MALTRNGLKWFNTTLNGGVIFGTEIKKEDTNSIIYWTGPSYLLGIKMVDVYRNGVLLQYESYQELTGNSIEYLDWEANPIQFGDVFSIRYRPGKVSLGNVIIADNIGELESLPNVINGSIGITTNDYKFWIYEVNEWTEFAIPMNVKGFGMVFDNEEQPIVSEKEYILKNISYIPKIGNLLVFIDGQKINPDEYIETNPTTITFNSSLIGKEVQFLVANTDAWLDSVDSSTTYEYDVYDNVIKKTVTLEDGVIPLQSFFVYDVNHNVIKETISKGIKTTTKIFTYDERENVISCKTTIT